VTAKPRYSADCVIAGAGVVGLAIARALAMAGRDVLIIEDASAVGTGISSRNSEVIHAGIYYPKGSLKAACCVAGKWALYDYLKTRKIDHRRCGKLIVAADEDEAIRLRQIVNRAEGNGVADLRILERRDLLALEPTLNAGAAIHSPSTGILDSHALMLSLLGEAEDHGARVALGTKVAMGEARSDGQTELHCEGDDPCLVTARTFVNSAGLGAVKLARRMAGLRPEHVPDLYLAKGSYFTLAGHAPFSHLIYPVPVPGGLGVHLTLDLGGAARFGPDVEWVDTIDYTVAPDRAEQFYDAIRAYWPDLEDGALQPGYAGIRPKLAGPGENIVDPDFQILGPEDHGLPGQVHLFGIESPGLTACLEIARRVVETLADASDS